MTFGLHATTGVYYGRPAYPLADPINLFQVAFPTGIEAGAQCLVLSSFAKDYSGNTNRVFTSISPQSCYWGIQNSQSRF